ncbi:hypothetical protein GGU11DRAFT_755822 [Lentinula aff. detonsa]|uniref:Uncharacterized protein n=1 Tax=Lentinula aff. detonsa TaxID=2804958 RepID=A0AA38KUH2_9AGAR|nr:hypothetical protein GGU10DRAFT_432247 [Lentinula aff. detonsa]KAJ3798619.1 hypothetical protein GGU11DRAFT_755822 [Lentinula aff. detonsa]
MKTRIAVRDRTPHRFQVVPLKDAKRNSSVLQISNKVTSLSNVRKGLKDVTNFQETTPRGSSVISGSKSIPCPDAKRGCHLSASGPTKEQSLLITAKAPEHRAPLKPETPLVNPIPQLKLPTAYSKCPPTLVSIQSVPVRPLNIVKRSPSGGGGSSPPLTGVQPPKVLPCINQDAIKPPTTSWASLQNMTTTAVSILPTFDFLNGPAESTISSSKHGWRSRSSNGVFTSKLPTFSARTRMNSEHSQVSECPDDRNPKTLTTVSNPTTPTICQYNTSPDTSASTIHQFPKDIKPTVSAAPTFKKRIPEDNQMSSKSINWRRTSKYLDSSLLDISDQTTLESRIPFAKSKAAFQSRTLDSALHKSRHAIAHSVDMVNLTPSLLQAPRTRQYQDVRSIFPKYGDLPNVAAEELTKSSEPGRVTPSAPSRRRSTVKSEIPSKRHAIYTRSLYVGKADKTSNDYLRCLKSMSSSSFTRNIASSTQELTKTEDVSAPSDSLESILKAYQDAIGDEGVHSPSISTGLPTSHSEPMLYDISDHSLGIACTDIAPFGETDSKPAGASISLSSFASIYSEDSWVSGERPGAQISNANDNVQATSNEQLIGQRTGHHPIVWELLEKLESAKRTWLWDAGMDKF